MRISGVSVASRKTHKARNAVITVLILLFLVVVSIVLISAYNAYVLIHPAIQPIEAFSSNIVPEYRDVNFKSSDKTVILNGWFFKSKNSDKTVVIAHSYGKNRLEAGTDTIELYKKLLDMGYNVLAFDLRYSGKSGGKNSTLGCLEKEDVLSAMNYVRQQGAKHIVLVGFSTGASACLMAAEESGKVETVIADTPYAKLSQYVNGYVDSTLLPKFPFSMTIMSSLDAMTDINNDNCSPVNNLQKLSGCNVMFIHSSADTFIPLEDNRQFYSEYSNLATGIHDFWETDAKGNASSFEADPSTYINKVAEFLGKLDVAETDTEK
ncbi:MAG: alpha/beta hydrolase [Clostridiales bacterium]|nr:alpha/beta hydrolase [Clostridiales bacterium]